MQGFEDRLFMVKENLALVRGDIQVIAAQDTMRCIRRMLR